MSTLHYIQKTFYYSRTSSFSNAWYGTLETNAVESYTRPTNQQLAHTVLLGKMIFALTFGAPKHNQR